MFRYIVLFALVVAVASAHPKSRGGQNKSRNSRQSTKSPIAYPCGKTGITNECAAEYLSQVAGCVAPTVQTIGDLSRPYVIEAPFFEGTINRYESIFSGIGDAYISAFYTDSSADRTVMSVTFPAVTNSGREILQYHDVSAIDTEVDTAFVIDYTGIVVTAQWKGVDSITIGTARVYSEVESTSYDIEADWPELAAEIANNPEGIAAQTSALAAANPEVLQRESVLYAGRAVARLWWNNAVCANLPSTA